MPVMRRSLAIALISLLFTAAAHAQAVREAQVREVDAKFRQAMMHGDTKLLASVIADDAKIIHGDDGNIQDKQGLLASHYHMDAYDRTPIFSKIGGDLAVLVSTSRKVSGDRVNETSTTEVFVRRSGRWWILVLQNTDHLRR
jgi:ketosteroid isomerase-like protein